MKKCFAIMSFNQKLDDVFEYGILPGVENKGYQCTRMDRTAGPTNLVEEMIHHIVESDLIIADLTDKSPNVFYELGIAHTFQAIQDSNNTIMLAEQQEEIPFDIASFRVLKYVYTPGGILDLKQQLSAQIDLIESKDSLVTNPIRDYFLKQKVRPKHIRRIKPGNDELITIINEQQLSVVRICILTLLNTLPETTIGLTISEICKALGIEKRKLAALALQEMDARGIVAKKKHEKNTYWYVSKSGTTVLKKVDDIIKVRLKPLKV